MPNSLLVGSPVPDIAVPAASWWPFLTWAWLIVFLIRCGRFGWDLTNNHRLAKGGGVETNPYWQYRLDQLAALLGISGRVRLLESSLVNGPAIIGVLKPVILIPLGVLASMPADQLEAVLLHELAHIRRKDYLVNLIQGMAEAIFFFNPALKWLSQQLRIEREHCCDDIALDHVNRLTFVQALVSFQEHSLYRRAFPLAFTGQQDRLLARVSRITGRPISSSRKGWLYLLVYLFPVLLAGWFSLNLATLPLPQGLISRLSGSQAPQKTHPVITSDLSPGPEAQLMAKKESPLHAKAVVQHTDTVSSLIHHKDSISWISSTPSAVTATHEVAQSEYEKEMHAYGEEMLRYKKTLRAYSEEMVQHKKTLQAYNEHMVRYRKTIQDYNQEIVKNLDDLAVKPPD
ncbi:MAG: hypothetical protein EOO20_10030 [Chryseobacterium sp.]|nr:MAG: hypothetical protein EOO20_10030 [Chryseobacterium sp.]